MDDIEAMKADYRRLNGLADDAPVLVSRRDDRYLLWDPSSFVFRDGGTLDLGLIYDSRFGGNLLQRAWWWLRWGWRR